MDLDVIGAQSPHLSIDDTEMLIRSASTLLSLVHPLAGAPTRRSPDQHIAQFLDRFSIIFVSGRHHADVVATVPIFDPDKKLQVVAMMQDDEPGEQEDGNCGFHVVKNRVHHMRLLESNEQLAQLAQELQDDEISFFIKRGHNPLTFDLHVRHLEWLLNRTYNYNMEPTPDNLDRLKKYVYLYCAPKIKQRFDMELSGGRGKFINFFLDTDRTSYRLSYENYENLEPAEAPDRFPDFKPKWSEETWLIHRANQLGGELTLNPADPSSIGRTPKAGYRMYVLIATHFRLLHRGLSAISPYLNPSPNLRTANATNRGEINNALMDIATALSFLHRALSYSRAFWRTIFTMGTHFQNQVVSAIMEHFRPPDQLAIHSTLWNGARLLLQGLHG
ncbi:hypothetical protein M407DRAFT_194182 [Tulasnella calospora MUT 4182]|uniref:Uncharacterized protein n=1 Tax=Tulasnella calospora MUT 4182 TaxID=1051891 RepID=A0A0C3QKS8_9AGAM|nr:hypothetical protein M407DRAFT_194182 [Tulasnella calospora MUT 4182]